MAGKARRAALHSDKCVWRILLASFLVFVAASLILYRNRHRIIDHGAKIDPTEAARQVLIMGLSPLLSDLQRKSLACLQNLVKDEVPLDRLAGTRDDLAKEEFYRGIDELPWLQNLRAVRYHRQRLKRILIVPSVKSYEMKQEFENVLQGALQCPGFPIDWIGEGIDYEDYNAIQRALEEAVKCAKKAGFPDSEISIDVTAGFKPFGIVRLP